MLGLDLRCPTCRRRIEGEDHCPRCGTGMEMLRRIAAEAERLTGEGWSRLRAAGGETAGASAALAVFETALRLRDTPGARQGRVVALAACGRFGEAAGLLAAEQGPGPDGRGPTWPR